MSGVTATRVIGIRPRVKRTAKDEAHPTQIVIQENSQRRSINLENEQAELDFVRRRFPVKYRDATANDDPSQFPFHQLKVKELKRDDEVPERMANLVITQGNHRWLVTKVPAAYEGLQQGDFVAMSLGGIGDNLAFAMSRRLQDMDGRVLRIPPHALKEYRGEDKANDANHLIDLLYKDFGRFYAVTARDRDLIRVRELYRLLEATMKDRIACVQRIRQLVIGQIFCSEDGLYPEGALEKAFDEAKIVDSGYQALVATEKNIENKLANALRQLPVYNEVFVGIEGVGTRISARIISIIGDIRLFEVQPDEDEMAQLYDLYHQVEEQYYRPILDKIKGDFTPEMTIWQKLVVAKEYYRRTGNSSAVEALQVAIHAHGLRSKLRRKAHQRGQNKLKAFLGVGLVQDERQDWVFARHRTGERCSWSPTGRQALYLLGEQCNKRPDSQWGKALRQNKAALRLKHPAPLVTRKKLAGLTRSILRCFNRYKVEIDASQFNLTTLDGLYELLQSAVASDTTDSIEFVDAIVSFEAEIAAFDKSAAKSQEVNIFTPAHIHKMAIWRTLSQFVCWLFDEWTKLEHQPPALQVTATTAKQKKSA